VLRMAPVGGRRVAAQSDELQRRRPPLSCPLRRSICSIWAIR